MCVLSFLLGIATCFGPDGLGIISW